MVGHVCQCGRDLRGYDAPDLFFTVHFSCLQVSRGNTGGCGLARLATARVGGSLPLCYSRVTARPLSPTPCAQEINKPGEFASEHAFMQKVWGSNSCVRHYFLMWHAAFRRAGLRLPAPYWDGPPVPDHNLTHDRVVRACQNCE